MLQSLNNNNHTIHQCEDFRIVRKKMFPGEVLEAVWHCFVMSQNKFIKLGIRQFFLFSGHIEQGSQQEACWDCCGGKLIRSNMKDVKILNMYHIESRIEILYLLPLYCNATIKHLNI